MIRPAFLIVAGPNGSGKSTSYTDENIQKSGRNFWIINPDLLAARIRDQEQFPLGEANLAAVQRIESWLEASIDAYQTVGVETVLSTPKYRRLVEQAKRKHFEIWFTYVVLDNPLRNVERVRARVAGGGHNVPEDKIVERYHRSLEQMSWFLAAADRALIYDNSGDRPIKVARKADGVVTALHPLFPALESALTRIPLIPT